MFACLLAATHAVSAQTDESSSAVAVAPYTSNGADNMAAEQLEDQAVVVSFNSYEGDESQGNLSVEEYQVYVVVGGKENLVNIEEYSCCKDSDGQCQAWGANSKLTCHGIDVEVDYHVMALKRATGPSGDMQHYVYYPQQMKSGAIVGQEAEDVEMTYEEWQTFQQNALDTLLKAEIGADEDDSTEAIDDDKDEASESDNGEDTLSEKIFHHPLRLGLLIAALAVVLALFIVVVRRCCCRGRRGGAGNDTGLLDGQYAPLN